MNRFETIRVLDTKYAYALGVIRAREVRLLTKKRFEELFNGLPYSILGAVSSDNSIKIYSRDKVVINSDVALLFDTYKSRFRDF